MDIINSIISLGASVMMPVIFFIIALCFGVKIGTAFKPGCWSVLDLKASVW